MTFTTGSPMDGDFFPPSVSTSQCVYVRAVYDQGGGSDSPFSQNVHLKIPLCTASVTIILKMCYILYVRLLKRD